MNNTEQTQPTELKECPFCGNNAELETGYNLVQCADRNCDCIIKRKTDEEAITAWNTRATDKRVEELERELSIARQLHKEDHEALTKISSALFDRDDISWTDSLRELTTLRAEKKELEKLVEHIKGFNEIVLRYEQGEKNFPWIVVREELSDLVQAIDTAIAKEKGVGEG